MLVYGGCFGIFAGLSKSALTILVKRGQKLNIGVAFHMRVVMSVTDITTYAMGSCIGKSA